ncbi:VWA domain-containing protein [Adhaeribacter pallidiroseus]|uniref:VWA domain-containing protein n=1 Tax=Adhaeribacter pallidiroseus TaxID=2072847 RepID=UPI000E1BC464|nr:VWA domain-containing protein [Adhaeribacter pallidiroseus]
MNQFKLSLTYSPWLIVVCLLLGAIYAWLLYSKTATWPKSINYLLAGLRFVVVSFLTFLLLGPFVRAITNTTQKPTLVLAIDNSESVKLFTQPTLLNSLLDRLDQLKASLGDKDLQIAVRTLSGRSNTNDNLAKLAFTAPATNLDQLLSGVQEEYESRNLAGVVLLSDGIINQGKSPAFSDYNFRLFPVAVGDTIPKKDLSIPALSYNKVAYSGNRFPIIAEVSNQGFTGQTATVLLRENNKTLERKTVKLTDKPANVEFAVTAAQPGKKHYEVVLEAKNGEFTKLNNLKHAYLDIVKGKLKILLAAATPHPDIKAIKSAIETNENFQTELYIPGVFPLKAATKYDLVILHQLPSRLGTGNEVLALIKQQKVPAFYIIGAQSDLAGFNHQNAGLAITRKSNQVDEVVPVFNVSFTKFKVDASAPERLSKYPPAEAPFADIKLAPNAEVILSQQIGKLKTTRPLLIAQVSGETRSATLLADGSWQWRLTEAANYDKPDVFDKIIVSTAQLLTSASDKKRLNVYPVQDEYLVHDDIRFEAETYNSIYEKIYGQKITLKLTDEKNKVRSFSFENGEGFSGLNIGNLPGGVYKYEGSATHDGRLYRDRGEFVVQDVQLEAVASLADLNLLHQAAQKSDSRVYYPHQIDQLEKDILKADFKNVIYSSENIQELINQKWLFFILLAFITVEWLIRKYNGAV